MRAMVANALLIAAVAAAACTPAAIDKPAPQQKPERPPETNHHIVLERTEGHLNAAWATVDGTLHVVGGTPEISSRVLQYARGAWTDVALPLAQRLWWVSSPGANELWAVGDAGAILHHDGAGWVLFDVVDEDLFGVWGAATNDVWAVGGGANTTGPVLLHWDGAVWTRQDLSSLELPPVALFKVWGSAADDVFVVGGGGVVLHYDGQTWTRMASPTTQTLISVHGRAHDDVFAVGGPAPGVMLHYDGVSWSQVYSTPAAGLNGVFAEAGRTDAVVVGFFGFAARVDVTGAATSIPTGTSEDLHGVFCFNDDKIVMVGGNLLSPEEPNGVMVFIGDGAPASTVERTEGEVELRTQREEEEEEPVFGTLVAGEDCPTGTGCVEGLSCTHIMAINRAVCSHTCFSDPDCSDFPADSCCHFEGSQSVFMACVPPTDPGVCPL